MSLRLDKSGGPAFPAVVGPVELHPVAHVRRTGRARGSECLERSADSRAGSRAHPGDGARYADAGKSGGRRSPGTTGGDSCPHDSSRFRSSRRARPFRSAGAAAHRRDSARRLASRALGAGVAQRAAHRRGASLVLAFVGGVFWVVGVYQKESVPAVIPLLVAIAIAGRGSARALALIAARATSGNRGDRRSRRAPPHHTSQSRLCSSRRAAISSTRPRWMQGAGSFGALEILADWITRGLPGAGATARCRGAFSLAVIVAIVRRRIDVLVSRRARVRRVRIPSRRPSRVWRRTATSSRCMRSPRWPRALGGAVAGDRSGRVSAHGRRALCLVRFRGSVRGSRLGERRRKKAGAS